MRNICQERFLCKDASLEFAPIFFSSRFLLVEDALDQLRQQEGEGKSVVTVGQFDV